MESYEKLIIKLLDGLGDREINLLNFFARKFVKLKKLKPPSKKLILKGFLFTPWIAIKT